MARPPGLRPGGTAGEHAARGPTRLSPRLRVLAFLALYAGFTLLWQALADTAWLVLWIEGLIVPAAAAWLNAVPAGLGFGTVLAEGAQLASSAAALNVLPGCEGSDVMALVAAAVLVAPRPGWIRWLGLGLLLAAVFVLNQLRLAALLWALARDRAIFESLHTLWLPLALVLLSAGLFVAWLAVTESPAAPTARST